MERGGNVTQRAVKGRPCDRAIGFSIFGRLLFHTVGAACGRPAESGWISAIPGAVVGCYVAGDRKGRPYVCFFP